jgi:hypothetical protein
MKDIDRDRFMAPEEAVASVNAQLDKGADFIKLWLDDELGDDHANDWHPHHDARG